MVYSNIEFNNSGAFDPDGVYQGILENEKLNSIASNESYEVLQSTVANVLNRFNIDRHQSVDINARQMKYEGVEGWKADIAIQIMDNSEVKREWDAKILIFNSHNGRHHAALAVNKSSVNELLFVTYDLPYISYALRRGEIYDEPIIDCYSGVGIQEVSRFRCEETEVQALTKFIHDVFTLDKTQRDL